MKKPMNERSIEYSRGKLCRYNWLITIAINAAILIGVLVFTDIMYETNDDFAISEKIIAGYPYIGFVSYYLCRILIAIQKIVPDINIFILSQLIMSFLSLVVVLKVVLDRSRHITEVILATVVLTFFSLDHYSSVQFTKTSALLMTAGLIVIVDAYINRRDRRLFFITYSILGYMLFFIGVSYRQKGMFPALGIAGAFVIAWLMLHGRKYYSGRRPIPEVLIIALLVTASLVPYALDLRSDAANESTPELKLGREYQAERVKITDYPMIENYDEYRDQYDEIGLSENDLYLIDRWIFDYDGAASLDNLKKINEINYPGVLKSRSIAKACKKFLRGVYKAVMGMNTTGMHIIILIALALYALSALPPKNWLYILAIGMMTISIYIAVYYLGRPQYRAFYVADIGAAIWLLYTIVNTSNRNTRIIRVATCIVAVLLTVAMIIPARQSLQNQKSHIDGLIESEEVTEYFAAHMDSFYIGVTTTLKQPKAYCDPLSVSIPAANVSGTGGWETMTPYKLNFLSNYGIVNPIKDLINNPNAYLYGDYKKERMKEYYNKWYSSDSEKIEFIKVDEIAGNNVYRVVSMHK